MTLSKKEIIDYLASPKVFFYCCAWLVVLVFFGTIEQKDIGLYAAQNKYFSSWFLWIRGVLPLPGGGIVMATIFVSLFCKLVFKSPWNRARWGTNISHFGVLILLGGSFVTSRGAYEGILVVAEGSEKSYFADFHEYELAFIDHSFPDKDRVKAIAQSQLGRGAKIALGEFGGSIRIIRVMKNAGRVESPSPAPVNHRGAALKKSLIKKDTEKEHEHNVPALLVELSGMDEGYNGIYNLLLMFEHPYLDDETIKERPLFESWREAFRTPTNNFTELPQVYKFGGKAFSISLRKRRYNLPFTIALDDVETLYYEGSKKVKSYSSTVNVKKPEGDSRFYIYMNNPMRYYDFTAVQNKVLGARQEITGLAIVKNAGYLIPYISSVVICIGLLIHLVLNVSLLKYGGKDDA
jgi:hypothetical protein